MKRKLLTYKLLKSVVPCILLTLCIGFCYSFSLFVPHIAAVLGCTTSQVGFTFCLNIFFLGMGAAVFGPLVEQRIRLAAVVSTVLLVSGLLLAGLACIVPYGGIWLMYMGAGLLCGLAEGCGYVTPNKNMLLWFPKSKLKGLLAAISIFTFGLGSALCAWLFGMLFPILGIAGTFFALAGIYGVSMVVAASLIQKPKYALAKLRRMQNTPSEFSYIATLKDRFFQKTWLFMFLNISMGLILIGSCASLLAALGFSNMAIITLMMFCGLFNGIGRLVFPILGDCLDARTAKGRSLVWVVTALLEVVFMLPVILAYGTGFCTLTAALCIVLIHAGYGSAFACLPSILYAHYGKDTLSQRHGFCLTAWGMASLMAFLCTTFVLSLFNGFLPVMLVVVVGYIINIFVALSIANHRD